MGSPPPMRGKVPDLRVRQITRGITPAYAGKSSTQHAFLCCVRDHPRLCGEKAVFCNDIKCCVGSPPPMRGKVPVCLSCPVLPGITPAYAGKRHSHTPSSKRHRDHPRLCGEKTPHASRQCKLAGSPPPMRGKGGILANPVYCGGITPAYAGKSRPRQTAKKDCWDHPRLCGEKMRIS